MYMKGAILRSTTPVRCLRIAVGIKFKCDAGMSRADFCFIYVKNPGRTSNFN